MALIIDVFAQYVGADGSAWSLSKGEMKVLLEKELPGFLQSRRDMEAVDKLLKHLDTNGDAMVDFNEFTVFVAAITSACESYLPQKELN